jgi:hypothetical protein
MRLLNTLNQIVDRLINNNFQYIKNWADATTQEIELINSEIEDIKARLDALET